MNSWVMVKPVFCLAKLLTNFQSVHPWVQIDVCALCNKIPSISSWEIAFTRMGRTSGHSDLRLQNQFIVQPKWTFVPNFKKFPEGVPEISHWHEQDGCMKRLVKGQNKKLSGEKVKSWWGVSVKEMTQLKRWGKWWQRRETGEWWVMVGTLIGVKKIREIQDEMCRLTRHLFRLM